jgi:ABC-type uncharacterized transport system substrate-binding protein
MKRRTFMSLLGGAAAAGPLAARAQQPERVRRTGVLNPFGENDQAAQANLTAFRQALQKLGWTEGRNLRSDYRWGDADPGRIRAQAIELVNLKPDVILVSTSLALQPLQQETHSIPIVVVQTTDPVGSGFVESLARPGGNITGFTVAEFSMFGKLLEVLMEVAPLLTRVAVVLNPDQAPQLGMWRAIERVAPAFKVQLTAAGVRDVAEVERAIDLFRQWNRRQFMTLLGGMAAWLIAARAQLSNRERRVGLLTSVAQDDPRVQAQVSALRQELDRLGCSMLAGTQRALRLSVCARER